jgi:hypothetical protein
MASGESDASPVPSPMRMSIICQKFFASPQPAVNKLHPTKPTVISPRRFAEFAVRPRGMSKNVENRAKAAPMSSLICVSWIFRSRRIGATSWF